MGFLGNNLGMLNLLKIKTKEYYTNAYLKISSVLADNDC